MQANNIWAGNDYAWRGNSGRSERFSLACERVRVRRVIKETQYGNAKATTFAIVQFIDRDTGEVLDGPNRWAEVTRTDDDRLYKVRAYDIIANWEEVADEYQHLIVKQRREQAEREQAERERRERIEREQAERQLRLDAVKDYLIRRGVRPDWIEFVALDSKYGYGNAGIKLSFDKVEQAMNSEKVVKLPSAG